MKNIYTLTRKGGGDPAAKYYVVQLVNEPAAGFATCLMLPIIEGAMGQPPVVGSPSDVSGRVKAQLCASHPNCEVSIEDFVVDEAWKATCERFK